MHTSGNVTPARVSSSLTGDRDDRSALRPLFDSGHDRFRSPHRRRKPRTCEKYLYKNTLMVSWHLGHRPSVEGRMDALSSSR